MDLLVKRSLWLQKAGFPEVDGLLAGNEVLGSGAWRRITVNRRPMVLMHTIHGWSKEGRMRLIPVEADAIAAHGCCGYRPEKKGRQSGHCLVDDV